MKQNKTYCQHWFCASGALVLALNISNSKKHRAKYEHPTSKIPPAQSQKTLYTILLFAGFTERRIFISGEEI
jgi:hypothetical protein